MIKNKKTIEEILQEKSKKLLDDKEFTKGFEQYLRSLSKLQIFMIFGNYEPSKHW